MRLFDEGNAIVFCMTASHVDIKKIESLAKSVKMNLIESLKVKPWMPGAGGLICDESNDFQDALHTNWDTNWHGIWSLKISSWIADSKLMLNQINKGVNSVDFNAPLDK